MERVLTWSLVAGGIGGDGLRVIIRILILRFYSTATHDRGGTGAAAVCLQWFVRVSIYLAAPRRSQIAFVFLRKLQVGNIAIIV